ncbi:MAG: hypothetical protein Tsb0015_08750 [Simkaniaceae bacterium]
MERDFGQDKVKKICDVIKQETLRPAQEEAKSIIENAHLQARKIVDAAKKEASDVIEEAKKQMESERNVFKASLHLACKQTLASLKEEIERKLFNSEIINILSPHTRDPKIVAELISAVADALRKDGVDAEILAVIPKTIKPEDIAALLAESILSRLKEGEIALGEIKGGAQIKLEGKYVTIDISEEALKELVASFVREDFRNLIFSS